jgi:PAT family beta-lactamase induction signal transducer AmpG
MYAAQAFELGTSGLGSGAFGVLLLRLTQKRFSATQYALLSSLFSIPRVLAGPPAGLLADALGWRDFFVLTLAAGVPGLIMLQRFVPWGQREPRLDEPAAPRTRETTRGAIAAKAAIAGALTWLVALLLMSAVAAIKVYRAGGPFDLVAHLGPLVVPQDAGGWLTAAGIALTGLTASLLTAAALAARGLAKPLEP